DAVIRRLAGLLAAVVADFTEALDDLIFDSSQVWTCEIPHLRSKVLELVRQHAPDLDLNFVHVADEEADVLIARHRQQRALSQERQRLRIRFDACCANVGLSGKITTNAFYAVCDRDENVSSDRSQEFEGMRCVAGLL